MKASSIPLSVIVCIGIVAALPLIPDIALEILDHPVFRVLLIVGVLAAMRISVYTGILVLIVIAALLIQRNYRKMQGIVYVKTNTSYLPRMKEDEDMPVAPSIHYAQPDEPTNDVYRFEPFPDTGSDSFKPVPGAASIDYKIIPESASLVRS